MQANYTTLAVSDDYKCHRCGAGNCKLWREYATVNPKLACANCAIDEMRIDRSRVNAAGQVMTEFGAIDSLGWYVPAIPTEDTDTFWGLSSAPKAAFDWWRQLPAFPEGD